MNSPQYVILIFLWIIFGFFHSLFATEKWKKAIEHLMKEHYEYYRVYYSLFAAVSLTALLFYHFNVEKIVLWSQTSVQKVIAVAGNVAGLTIMAICAKKYFFEITGIEIFLKSKPGNGLQKNGVHKFVRHPLYLGTLIFVWSIFLWEPSVRNIISCVCITMYVRIGIYFEEKKLVKTFGDEYKVYAQRVPMLLPKIFRKSKFDFAK